MRVFGLQGVFARLSKYSNSILETLPDQVHYRLRMLRVWRRHGIKAALTASGVSRATLYRWRGRLEARGKPSDLRDRSRRPHRCRRPQWSRAQERRVKELRERYGWGKDKLARLLEPALQSSVSTVGRILSHLKRRGELKEPPKRPISAKKRRKRRTYATRKPKDYQVRQAGDLVQVDTMDIRPLPGVDLKQFTARDFKSRWDVIRAYSRATAKLAENFLEVLLRSCPFPIKAIQVDGGSEFYAEFERACQRRGILLFVLPPRSPKLNGRVERANRTHAEEFYERTDCSWKLSELNQQLAGWQHIYNTVRPHQAIGFRTPLQYLQDEGIVPPSRASPAA